jgi:hypothetical protein
MATLAPATEGTAVHIIRSMAVGTGGRQSDFSGRAGFVTAVAIETLMGACQRVTRLSCMIEPPGTPTVRSVATTTGGTKTPVMVGILVTVAAGQWSPFEALRLMALLTNNASVPAYQRKTRQVMIKRNLLSPACFVVAIVTASPELSVVNVVFAMARHTCRSKLYQIDIAGVTGLTLDRGVAPLEWELCSLVVIE